MTTCNDCIYCVYSSGRYRCWKDWEGIFIKGKDTACECFLKAQKKALHDDTHNIPRRMGIQWA